MYNIIKRLFVRVKRSHTSRQPLTGWQQSQRELLKQFEDLKRGYGRIPTFEQHVRLLAVA